MTIDFDYMHDPETFGLALFWNAPLGDTAHGCALGAHRITLVLGTFVFGIEWRTNE